MKYPLPLIRDNGLARNNPNLAIRLQPVFAARGVAPTISPPRFGAPSGRPGRILNLLLLLLPEIKRLEPEKIVLQEPTVVVPVEEFDADMLHGVIDTGTIVASRLHQFQPTQVCARVNSLPFEMQDSAKLAIDQYRTVKPGNFSGLMKRLAQAVLGVGVVKDSSPDFFTGTKPDPVTKTTHALHYDYRFSRTHGIYKAADKNHWLIEVSQANGVLAMPLPLFRNTMTPRYRSKVSQRDDTDTLAVLDEYGGIPTGDTFPSGDALTAAISTGTVLRLLASADLADFYDKSSFTPAWGWAFNSDGSACDNTCWEFLLSGDFTGYRKTYHYSLALTLSAHDTTVRPVGSGSAALSLVSSGVIFAPWYETDTLVEKKSDACLFVPDASLLWLNRFHLTANTATAAELTTAGATKVKGVDDSNLFGMTAETVVKATFVPFPAPGGFPQISSDIGNAPVFVFYREDDTREIVLYGTDNSSENYNTLWSDTIDRRTWDVGPPKVAAHTMFIGLPHCREGWAAYTHTATEAGASRTSVLNLDLYTAREGLVALTPPTGYADPGIGGTSYPADAYTAYVVEYRIGDLEWSDFFPIDLLFDMNENGGPATGWIRYGSLQFPGEPSGTPYTIDRSSDSFEHVDARSIPLDGIVPENVNWVGHV